MSNQESLILIIDSDPTTIQDVNGLLNDRNYRLENVLDGEKAMDFVKDQSPDVILLETLPPKMNGYEICKAFKTDQATKHIPVIFISPRTDEDAINKGFEAGGADYVSKPFIASELVAKINTHLSIKKAHKELEIFITERTKVLNQAKEEAEQASRLKSEFLANMSHGLRTSMHAILSFSKFGIDKLAQISEEKKLYYFQKIKTSGDQLMVLLDDLLDLSKLETGEGIFSLESVNSLQIVKDVVSKMEKSWKSKNLNIKIEDPLISTKIDSDKDKLKQIIHNLLSNAIKFTPENKNITFLFKKSKLLTDPEQADSETVSALTISIIDEGIGIPNTELDTVFDKFIQSSKTKSGVGGTGLGLSICKEIVKAHYGKIWAEKNPKGGVIFSITLPYEQMK